MFFEQKFLPLLHSVSIILLPLTSWFLFLMSPAFYFLFFFTFNVMQIVSVVLGGRGIARVLNPFDDWKIGKNWGISAFECLSAKIVCPRSVWAQHIYLFWSNDRYFCLIVHEIFFFSWRHSTPLLNGLI